MKSVFQVSESISQTKCGQLMQRFEVKSFHAVRLRGVRHREVPHKLCQSVAFQICIQKYDVSLFVKARKFVFMKYNNFNIYQCVLNYHHCPLTKSLTSVLVNTIDGHFNLDIYPCGKSCTPLFFNRCLSLSINLTQLLRLARLACILTPNIPIHFFFILWQRIWFVTRTYLGRKY